jgi:eukaryotic-like serine/threonine-protein kinase
MKVGRFLLEREIARGGMGSVWAAREGEAGGMRVALKTVLATKRASAKVASLFVEEARISAKVRHPNLLQIFDAGEDEGVPFLAMEWVEGVTLRRLAERSERMPLPLLLRVCMEACDGLHAAHEARTDDGVPLHVVHRDVSPHNLLVDWSGRVKVIDFGIAKAKGRLAEETTDGVLRGKVRYMAPEHALGDVLDRRADIWSLGVTLLETATGSIPYSGEHDIATLVKLVSCEPELPDEGSLPPAVWSVVRRALRKDRMERYATARDMGTELDSILKAMGTTNTRRDLAYLVRDELRSTMADARPMSISDKSTARFETPRMIAERQVPVDSVTAPVPQAVLEALIDHELREKPTASQHPTPVVPPEVIPALFVNTSMAVFLAELHDGDVDDSRRDSVDLEASGPVPRPGRRRSGFIVASLLMVSVLVGVVGVRGTSIEKKLRGLASAREGTKAAASIPVQPPPPVEAVSIAPFRVPVPSAAKAEAPAMPSSSASPRAAPSKRPSVPAPRSSKGAH